MEITHKLPEWSSGKYGEVCTTEKDFGAIKVYYDIYQIDEFKVLASISHHCRSHIYPLEMDIIRHCFQWMGSSNSIADISLKSLLLRLFQIAEQRS